MLRLARPGVVRERSGDDRLAARLLDLRLRGLREGVRRDGDRLGQLAIAEDLDAVAAALEEAVVTQRLLVDLGAGAKGLELADVDLRDELGERVVEPALGHTTLDRGLAAFEVRLEAARAGVLPLLATTGGLAEAGAHAATATNLLLRRPDGLREVAESLCHGCLRSRLQA